MNAIGRRLILTRHAKSSWDDPAQDDHDRPLNRRGVRGARELGDWLASRGYEPEEVLCSSARRTLQTWEIAAAAPLEVRADLRVLPQLYHAGPDEMLAVLRSARAHCVMMLGHNPGISAMAAMLTANPPMDSAFRRYPTAATTVYDFAVADWSEAAFGTAAVRDFFIPSHD